MLEHVENLVTTMNERKVNKPGTRELACLNNISRVICKAKNSHFITKALYPVLANIHQNLTAALLLSSIS